MCGRLKGTRHNGCEHLAVLFAKYKRVIGRKALPYAAYAGDCYDGSVNVQRLNKYGKGRSYS